MNGFAGISSENQNNAPNATPLTGTDLVPPKPLSFVYFAGSSDATLVKIGESTRPAGRMTDIRRIARLVFGKNNVYFIAIFLAGDAISEAAMHQRFSAHSQLASVGNPGPCEWYRWTADFDDYLWSIRHLNIFEIAGTIRQQVFEMPEPRHDSLRRELLWPEERSEAARKAVQARWDREKRTNAEAAE